MLVARGSNIHLVSGSLEDHSRERHARSNVTMTSSAHSSCTPDMRMTCHGWPAVSLDVLQQHISLLKSTCTCLAYCRLRTPHADVMRCLPGPSTPTAQHCRWCRVDACYVMRADCSTCLSAEKCDCWCCTFVRIDHAGAGSRHDGKMRHYIDPALALDVGELATAAVGGNLPVSTVIERCVAYSHYASIFWSSSFFTH